MTQHPEPHDPDRRRRIADRIGRTCCIVLTILGAGLAGSIAAAALDPRHAAIHDRMTDACLDGIGIVMAACLACSLSYLVLAAFVDSLDAGARRATGRHPDS